MPKARRISKRALGLVFALAAGALLFSCAPSSAPETPTPSTAASESEAGEATFSWSVDSNCASCHEFESLSAQNSVCLISNGHAELSCSDCHADDGDLANAHANVALTDTEGAKHLKSTAVEREVCLSCHSDDYTPDTAANVVAFTDSQGTTVNPHDLKDSPDHNAIACADCHVMHAESTPEEAGSKVCLSCHHKNVYECGTCH